MCKDRVLGKVFGPEGKEVTKAEHNMITSFSINIIRVFKSRKINLI